ncbi:MAG: hypothetical protein KKB82_00540 [Candidatus Omnitrophica bacterium]|nr:hypothetical protein [Candidatus Omnitrophota bacterium]
MTALESIRKSCGLAAEAIPLMVIVCIFNFITATIMLGIIGVNPNPDEVAQKVGGIFFFSGIVFLLWVLLEGGLFSSLYSKLTQNKLNLETFASNCLRFFGRLLVINLITVAVIIVLWVIGAFFTGLFIALGQGQNPFFNALGIILMGIAVFISFGVSIPMLLGQYLLVAEDGAVVASLKKGLAICRAKVGRIIFLFVLLAVIFVVISIAVNLIGFLFGKIIPAGWPLGIMNILLTSVVNGAYSIFASLSILGLILSNLPAVAQSNQDKEDEIITN